MKPKLGSVSPRDIIGGPVSPIGIPNMITMLWDLEALVISGVQ